MRYTRPGRFNPGRRKWEIVKTSTEALHLPALTLVTYNVWFSNRYRSARFAALLHIVRNCNADIIALQEITADHLEVLLAEEWIRESYYLSDIKGTTIKPYGVLLLSRLPMTDLIIHELPSIMYRKLVVGEFFINGQIIKVATVHLESMKESAPERIEQLDAIFPLLEGSSHAVLMGDFNFKTPRDGESRHIDPSYLDMQEVQERAALDSSPDMDLTATLEREAMKQILGFDRILARSATPGWQPQWVRLLGTEPIGSGELCVFPSDHFGLVGQLKWEEEMGREI